MWNFGNKMFGNNVAEAFILSNMCVFVYLESNQVCKRCVYMSGVRA